MNGENVLMSGVEKGEKEVDEETKDLMLSQNENDRTLSTRLHRVAHFCPVLIKCLLMLLRSVGSKDPRYQSTK